ncbi:MAG: PucC family protein [Sedimentitalea sp.]
MLNYRKALIARLAQMGPRYLPFADVASDEVPLSRLLRLSLFQVTVGMALVLLVGTLNRVMIVELNVSASLVGIMIALPLVFAPFRAVIGFRSDTHRSALGWRRIPYIWKGTMLQFGGFAVMPFALLVLSGYGDAVDAPLWIGHCSAALAFLLVGAGVHMVQTVGLVLATDLVEEEDQPKVVGLMYVMLLLGMIVSAFVFGALLENYSPGRLIQVIQAAAVLTIVLNGCALWKQEARNRTRATTPMPKQQFRASFARLMRHAGAVRLLVVIALGTFGFGMADVLLEPYGGQVLDLSVAQTTKLTALLALGSLFGFGLASHVLGAGGNPVAMSWYGALVGVPAFCAIIASAYLNAPLVFAGATVFTGVGAGLFGHGTLTATMRAAPRDQIGLALGAWGAVQATAAGLGVALGGVARDLILLSGASGANNPELPYVPVFGAEALFLLAAMAALYPMLKKTAQTPSPDVFANSKT